MKVRHDLSHYNYLRSVNNILFKKDCGTHPTYNFLRSKGISQLMMSDQRYNVSIKLISESTRSCDQKCTIFFTNVYLRISILAWLGTICLHVNMKVWDMLKHRVRGILGVLDHEDYGIRGTRGILSNKRDPKALYHVLPNEYRKISSGLLVDVGFGPNHIILSCCSCLIRLIFAEIMQKV